VHDIAFNAIVIGAIGFIPALLFIRRMNFWNKCKSPLSFVGLSTLILVIGFWVFLYGLIRFPIVALIKLHYLTGEWWRDNGEHKEEMRRGRNNIRYTVDGDGDACIGSSIFAGLATLMLYIAAFVPSKCQSGIILYENIAYVFRIIISSIGSFLMQL